MDPTAAICATLRQWRPAALPTGARLRDRVVQSTTETVFWLVSQRGQEFRPAAPAMRCQVTSKSRNHRRVAFQWDAS